MQKLVKIPPKLIIEVVYRSKDKTWRGFCAPFDVSCTAKTTDEARKKLDELVGIYIDAI